MSRDHRLTVLEQRVRRAGGRWDADDERQKARAMTNEELAKHFRALAAEFTELGAARQAAECVDLANQVEALQRRNAPRPDALVPPLTGPGT